MELTEILEHIRRYANRNPELIYFAISGIVVLLVILLSLPKKQKVKHLTSIEKIAQQIRDSRKSGVICFPEKIEAKWVGKIQPKTITDKQEYYDIQTEYAMRYIQDVKIRGAFYDYFAGEPLRFVEKFWNFTDAEMKIIEQHISDFESEYRFEKKIKGQEIDILVYEETGYVPDSIKKSYKIWKRGQIYKELANYPWTPQTPELGDPVYSNGKLVGNVVKYVNDRTCEVKTPEPEVTEIKYEYQKTPCPYNCKQFITGESLVIAVGSLDCTECKYNVSEHETKQIVYCKHPRMIKVTNNPTNTDSVWNFTLIPEPKPEEMRELYEFLEKVAPIYNLRELAGKTIELNEFYKFCKQQRQTKSEREKMLLEGNWEVSDEPTNTIECEKDKSTQNSVKVKVYKNGKFKNNWYLSKDKSQSIEAVIKALKDVNKFSDADIKRIKPQLQEAWDKWVEIHEPKPPVKPDTKKWIEIKNDTVNVMQKGQIIKEWCIGDSVAFVDPVNPNAVINHIKGCDNFNESELKEASNKLYDWYLREGKDHNEDSGWFITYHEIEKNYGLLSQIFMKTRPSHIPVDSPSRTIGLTNYEYIYILRHYPEISLEKRS